jgi:hypothetical protein
MNNVAGLQEKQNVKRVENPENVTSLGLEP